MTRPSNQLLTFSQVLNGFPYAPVKSSGVCWTLEGQATPSVLHLPVMKCGHGYGVNQVLPQWTVQDYLQATVAHFSMFGPTDPKDSGSPVLPVCPVAAHHGLETGSHWKPKRVPALTAGGGTPPPWSGPLHPEPASRRSSRPASSPPLSHARCSCHWTENENKSFKL